MKRVNYIGKPKKKLLLKLLLMILGSLSALFSYGQGPYSSPVKGQIIPLSGENLIGKCHVNSIGFKYYLSTLIGQPVVYANLKWESGYSKSDDCLSQEDFHLYLQVQVGYSNYWIPLQGAIGLIPKGNGRWGMNPIPGSPNWNELLLTSKPSKDAHSDFASTDQAISIWKSAMLRVTGIVLLESSGDEHYYDNYAGTTETGSDGDNEVSLGTKSSKEEYQRKRDSLKADAEKRDEERKEKYELQREEIDKQAKNDKEKSDETERSAQHRTESIVYAINSYPNTTDGRLREKFDADASRRAENAQALGTAIPSLVENTYGIIQGIQAAKETRQQRTQAYYSKEYEKLEKLIEQNEIHEGKRRQWKLRHQKQFITPESNAHYFLDRAYVDYYFSNDRQDADRKALRHLINLYFSDTANAKIKPRAFAKLANMLTWEDGHLLDYFLSTDFSQYLEEIKGPSFGNEVEASLKKLKDDADQIATQPFCAFFESAMMGGTQDGISGYPLYKKFSYSNGAPFQLATTGPYKLPQLPEGKQIAAVEFEVSKDAKKNHLFPYSKGQVSVYIRKVNSVHIVNLNSSFIFSFDKDLKNNVQLALLASDEATDAQTQDGQSRRPNDLRERPNNNDFSTTLVRYNADILYETSFGISTTINADIYFMLSHNFISATNFLTDADSDLFLGYLVDNESGMEDDGHKKIKTMVNQPMTKEEDYEFTWRVLKNFVNTYLDYGTRFSHINGLSMLLITDVRPTSGYCRLDMKDLLQHYPLNLGPM